MFVFKKWHRGYAFLLIVILVAGCSKGTENEVITLEDVLPQSKGNYDYLKDTLVVNAVENNEMKERLIQFFPEISFLDDSVSAQKQTLFMPDRLGYTDKNDIFFSIDSTSYHFLTWTFEDSLKTINAFYNWMDCFGNNCLSIKLNEEKNIGTEAFVVWVSNQNISYLSSSKEINLKTWQDVLFEEKNVFWYFIIKQVHKGKIKWVVSLSNEDEISQK